MREEDFFTSLNVNDYPEPPEEEEGVAECDCCGCQLYEDDLAVQDCFGAWICGDCFEKFTPEEIYDLCSKKYSPHDLYKQLGGKWEYVC